MQEQEQQVKTCIDFCSGRGGFSAAFENDPSWNVITVDINPEFDPDIVADISELAPSDDRLPDNPDVILASPPCTYFSFAGHHDDWDSDGKPVTDDARDAIALAHHVIGLCKALTPDYWIVENPRGRLNNWFRDPAAEITLCQYGAPYQKPTCLWGRVPPGFRERSCQRGDSCHEANPSDCNTTGLLARTGSANRAEMPYELSEELRAAVDADTDQQTLTESPVDSGHSDAISNW